MRTKKTLKSGFRTIIKGLGLVFPLKLICLQYGHLILAHENFRDSSNSRFSSQSLSVAKTKCNNEAFSLVDEHMFSGNNCVFP